MATTGIMTPSAFLAVIRDNALVEEEKLQGCLRTLTPSVLTGEDALPIADALVENGLLTRFQANLLLQGKSKSLRITSKYRLLDRLGAGGMGLVYLCEHIRMKRLVALKVLPNSQAKEAGNLERFHREAQAVAALKHQNIVQAYDVDADNGIHYLVMEYIDGLNLEKLVSKHGPLDPIRAAHYIAQAAEGLQHAAQRGLVHRDIKPSNLLIDREGYIKVLDMGLARFFDTRTDNLTERFDNHAVIGTADFISPEQALNSHEVDSRADIYSLGCTFYYLLSGQAPFHDANITQKLLMHQVREPVPIEEHVPGIDPEMADVLRKMMAKKPEDRFQTPGDVVAALTPWTEIAIQPPSELPENPHTAVVDRNGSGSTVGQQTPSGSAHSTPKVAPRPGRGMVTERLTESAIRRMDGLPKKSDDEDSASSRGRWLIGGAVLLVAIGGLVVLISHWGSGGGNKGSDENDLSKQNAGQKGVEKVAKKGPAPKAQPLSSGFVEVHMGSPTTRPAVQNGGIRSHPTDLLWFDLDAAPGQEEDYFAIARILRSHLIGGGGGKGSKNSSIVPFAVATGDGSLIPNSLLTIDDTQTLRALDLKDDFVWTSDFVGVKADSNVLAQTDSTLPAGTTTINALVGNTVNFSASREQSVLRVASGVLLFRANSVPNQTQFGAGPFPLTIDFNGHAGHLTVCSLRDFTKQGSNNRQRGGSYIIRAKFSNLANEPLVLSGSKSAVIRLENPDNSNKQLVIQGLPPGNSEPFRVICDVNGSLGAANGLVSLIDAALYVHTPGTLVIDRPLNLSKVSHLGSGTRDGEVHWKGKISGGKLITHGPGDLRLDRGDNDYRDGTQIDGGNLIVAGENGGTPVGSGSVTISQGGKMLGISGTIRKDLVLRGGTLTLGSEAGKSLDCEGRLNVIERTGNQKNSTVHFRLGNPKARPLVCHNGEINFGRAVLQVSFLDGFAPQPGAKYVLIENRANKRIVSNFENALGFSTIETTDHKWTAKISYKADADHNSESSDHYDVMLYNFAPKQP